MGKKAFLFISFVGLPLALLLAVVQEYVTLTADPCARCCVAPQFQGNPFNKGG